jgi:eukaryotic-like serine/threonine-protein kinase
VITGHLHEVPPPLPPSVPSAAAELVDWAMAKDPADRPTSAGMFARECRVAASQAKPVAAEPNRTTVDLLVSSSPPQRPTAPMPVAGVPEPRKRRGKGVLLGLAAVLAAVALTVGVMRFLDEDDPGRQGAQDDPSGDGTSEPESSEPATTAAESTTQEETHPLPEISVLVNAESGECLIGGYDYTADSSSTWMDECDDRDDGSEGDYEFGYEFDAAGGVQITSRFETSAGPAVHCVWWTGANLSFDEQCDVMTWQFTYLSTDEAEDADFWQIRASGDGNYCLDLSDQANDDGFAFPVLNPCSEGDMGQQWRTVAT